jgi:hypothetical protein
VRGHRGTFFELRRGVAEFGEKGIDEARHDGSVLGVCAANDDQREGSRVNVARTIAESDIEATALSVNTRADRNSY